ncbi:hypothetical protein XELAEV_18029095mg [Xenopus laevis]|uniref:Tyr recombinase domain-containing protein n=1 Tax=Xenopus laevis TaxID=8355 RepID=A0A974CRI8_XENLA|nr:hypothetical protein XELAEV_18029095mg [Xenopus laevis]
MELVCASLAKTTWASYCAAWREWEQFQTNHPIDVVAVELLAQFVLNLYRAEQTDASIRRKLMGIVFFLKLKGQEDFTKAHLIRQMIKGMGRKKQTLDQRKPITLDLLEKFLHSLQVVCFNDYEVKLFQCLFSITYFGAFRISEIVASSKTAVNGLHTNEISLFKHRLKIILRKSKTDQLGKGNIIWLGPIQNIFLCPVHNYQKLMAIRSNTGIKFFIHQDGLPVIRFQFTRVFSKCLKALGIQDENYSSHSFRIGAATQAALLDFSEKRIKKLVVSRWIWTDNQGLKFLENSKKKVNFSIAKFAKAVNMLSYIHVDLEGGGVGLYHVDRVHLLEIGQDIFNIGLQTAIERALLRWEVAKPH